MECLLMRKKDPAQEKKPENSSEMPESIWISLKIIASIENQETIKKSVKQGMGISIISRLAAEEETKSGDLLTFPIPKDEIRDVTLTWCIIKLSDIKKCRALC